ncbi:hypothetical protein CHLRE_02g095133v5 [Chlamydomonas reinhardtii]|uniref:NAD(P)-binding domain-containing protein n=1 Tax=Chlamydomonas reinhardtii TaxID=3055 RepID=A0A2K3E1Q4_CHLRE|nr:uncharacterized protein CHLRE_02g095133v5 [Chlamydomonas reinhardtii]PNW86750.1 hypothetical protein CHLRE_02g095133v5 [Chlamydomonas reinhardtii]
MLSSTLGRSLGTYPSSRPKCIPRASLRNPARVLVVRQNKIGDDLLDFVTAGPKLRKWYGAGERLTDGGPEEEPEEPEEQAPTGDAVLVTDADGGVGEQVVLQLILARQELKLLVKDVAAAKNAYGPYTTPLPAEAVAAAPGKALRGSKALVLLGRLPGGPALLEAARAARVAHVVLLTAAPGATAGGGGFSLGGLLGGGEAARDLKGLGDAAAAEAVRRCGIPYTLVQVAGLTDAGRGGGVRVEQQQAAAAGGAAAGARAPLSREGLGALVAGVVDVVPARGRTVLAQGAPATGSAQEQQEAIAAAVAALPEDA